MVAKIFYKKDWKRSSVIYDNGFLLYNTLVQTKKTSTNFWTNLEKPIVGLSPMDGVTDHPFRHIQKKYGKPSVVYTEFTSVEGVCHGALKLLKDFLYDETQRPIVAQIYGTTPDYFRQTAVILCQLGFDGIDINMGCPAKNVAHSGAGAALIKTPELAQEIVRATKAGIQDWIDGKSVRDCENISEEIVTEVERRSAEMRGKSTNKQVLGKNSVLESKRHAIPVSIKTRVGFDKPVIDEWMSALLEVEPVAIAIHGRTLTQHYSGVASWEQIGKAVESARGSETLILGNGDTFNYHQALERVAQYGVDGVLLGRATFGNPYVLHPEAPIVETSGDLTSAPPPEQPSLFAICLEHAYLYEETYKFNSDGTINEYYNFLPMRKHLGWYVKGVPNASEIRKQLFAVNSAKEVEQILKFRGLL
jgi:tRNA-dihydrouridine synthase B